MVRFSFGPNGEFFMESSGDCTPELVNVADELYRRITTSRNQCEIVRQAEEDGLLPKDEEDAG